MYGIALMHALMHTVWHNNKPRKENEYKRAKENT